MLTDSKNSTLKASSIPLKDKENIIFIRTAVVDWLYRVQIKVNFSRETLYSSIAIYDRVLLSIHVTRKDAQLYAATSLWISAKLEETIYKDISIFTTIANNKLTADQLRSTELNIFSSIGMKLNFPTSQLFITCIITRFELQNIEKFCYFFLDASLTSLGLIEVPSYIVAAGAAALGSASVGNNIPLESLFAFLGFFSDNEKELFQSVVKKIINLAVNIVKWGNGGIFEYYSKDGKEKLREIVKRAAKEFGIDKVNV
ncbi:Cyclin, N-terminal domain containing protein [Histomonas meleagridis]|uniref:Cyclin, N-terminal domain containing protein n=1 Tax=Histomonas meleagridis TaxID=135588 RepID=UPI00355A35EC|nr:Cyclin, N-terminal domain containing protein [Histomonas meleagridis]KAH0800421.1 Cyclin, N-terminal domain containing protein [Histomonas meleagridis]